MQENRLPGGSATRWGPLFGGRAHDWAETWEGPQGWGIPVYGHVLDRAHIGPGTSVLDCGCGAGRFAQMAADRGASVAGIDAAGNSSRSQLSARRVATSGWATSKHCRGRRTLSTRLRGSVPSSSQMTR
jgi:SAM-dependent methyltransferase